MIRRFSSQFLGMNSTVIYEKDTSYLIDPAVFPPETKHIKDFLLAHGIRKITILLTHTHGDHISGFHVFHDYPTYGHQCISEKAQMVRDNDIRYLRGIWRKQGLENLEELKFPDNIRFVPEGEFRQVPPYSFAFFHVPGHSTDMSAILIPEERLLLSGDMLIQAPTPFILHSIQQYWNSLKRFRILMEEYDIRCLIPGHGKPAKSRAEIIERIQNEQQYIQQFVWAGLKLYRAGIHGDDLLKELYQISPEYLRLHSHQTNVQTFMRELEDWSDEEINKLTI